MADDAESHALWLLRRGLLPAKLWSRVQCNEQLQRSRRRSLHRVRFPWFVHFIEPRHTGRHHRDYSHAVVQPELWKTADHHAVFLSDPQPMEHPGGDAHYRG